ncbi:Bacterial regulatory protein, GntR family [Streptomyces sp. YIM 121038]|uniref:GntR family transcriptional regulator n=1 Tax=Streptomyces sp. YIM 121038 TaxID=2136401 RepID=UPI001110A469|nr:GntR family transcriptional regulator [Streptomyces sp. YIM 121038]QCX75458.1 Bacterial regulatory protein, GntR family [Streptomyces sp. YIM 121038]
MSTAQQEARSIALDIKRRIEQGEWTDKLPTYRQLAEGEYRTTQATISKAVQTLRVWGVVITRPGGSVRIRPPKPVRVVVPGEIADWTAEDIGTEEMPTFSWIKRELDQADDATVWRQRRLLKTGDGVLCIEDIYTVEKAHSGVVGPDGGFHCVRTWIPADEEQKLLGMHDFVPVLALLTRTEGAVVVRIFPGDRVEAATRD